MDVFLSSLILHLVGASQIGVKDTLCLHWDFAAHPSRVVRNDYNRVLGNDPTCLTHRASLQLSLPHVARTRSVFVSLWVETNCSKWRPKGHRMYSKWAGDRQKRGGIGRLSFDGSLPL